MRRLVSVLALIFAVSAARGPQPPLRITGLEITAKFVQIPDGTIMGFEVRTRDGIQEVVYQSSKDFAKTWSPPVVAMSLPREPGAWAGPEALVDSKGEIHLVFLNDAGTGIIRTGEEKRRPAITNRRLDLWHAKTTGGRSQWLPPKKIWEGYTGSLNSFIQLRSGRMILPFSYLTKRTWGNRGEGFDAYRYVGSFTSTVIYSDDGDHWQLSPDQLKVQTPDITGAYGAVEPVALELKDGRVWMLIRTQMDRFYQSFSSDGAHWSTPQPSAIISSDSPAGLVRLKDRRIVLLWNQCLRYPYAYGGRQVLHGAVSEDEGRTWRGYREVMRDPRRDDPPPPNGDFGTAYPLPIALQDGRVLFSSGQGGGRRASFLLDPAWLYETRQRTDFSSGVEDWSIYGTHGVALEAHPPKSGVKVLALRKVEREWPAGAVWNFPMSAKGRLRIRILLRPGFNGENIGLTDHYSTPFDREDHLFNIFNLPIAPDGAVAGAALRQGQWHALEFRWDLSKEECRLLLDGRQVSVLRSTRQSGGINYLRLKSTSVEPDGGVVVESVEAEAQ